MTSLIVIVVETVTILGLLMRQAEMKDDLTEEKRYSRQQAGRRHQAESELAEFKTVKSSSGQTPIVTSASVQQRKQTLQSSRKKTQPKQLKLSTTFSPLQRRTLILHEIKRLDGTNTPISRAKLAKELRTTRSKIKQDIATLDKQQKIMFVKHYGNQGAIYHAFRDTKKKGKK